MINVHWRNEVANNELLGGSVDLVEVLLSLISPLATIHASFVQDLELCLQTWHAQTHPLGHILLNNIPTLLPVSCKCCKSKIKPTGSICVQLVPGKLNIYSLV